MIYLRRITSLNNFKAGSPAGQIATILMLIMVAMIIFILVTLNIGNVSFRATKIANAADSTALYLASTIATRAHYIYHALGDSYEYCVKGGWLGAVLAFLTAVVLSFIPGMQWYWVIAAAAIAGAAGNYIATGTLKGAIMGAIQGAAIGAGFALGPGALLKGASLFAPTGTITLLTQAGVIIGALALGTLTTGAVIYNQSIGEKRVGANMATLSKQLNGLPDYEGTREGVFLYAFNQVVDDPTMTDPDNAAVCAKDNGFDPSIYGPGGDPLDLDNDGETNEKSSCFGYWWYNHIENLKKTTASYQDLIRRFLENYLTPFYENALDFLRQTDRSEIECDCGSGAESPMTALFRAIKKCNYNLFWLPGPTKSDLLSYYDCPTNCNPPAGWDNYDASRMHYEDFIDYAKAILKPEECGFYEYDAKELSDQLRNRYAPDSDSSDWFDELFDPRDAGDYYDIFTGIAGWMTNWKNRIISIRDSLPGCQLAYNQGMNSINKVKSAANPYCGTYPPVYPCKWDLQQNQWSGPYFPNPVCKVYLGDENTLNTEINTVRNFVNNLVPHIIAKYFSNPCPSPGPGVTCSLLGNITINIRQICLDGNIHSKCDKTPLGVGTAAITYSYDYSYTCQCCSGNPPVCSNNFISNSGTGSDIIAAPDLDIPCMDKDSFLGALTDFRGYIDGLPDNFATIDEDNTINEDNKDEFQRVLDRLQEGIDSINAFLPGAKEMYNDLSSTPDNRAGDGAGSVVYKWDDTEGKHSAKVTSGPFRFPYTKKVKHGNFLVNKKCIELKLGKDKTGERTWIEITRTDPGEKILTSSGSIDLGLRWNPFRRPMTIKRKSRAYFTPTNVSIAEIK